MSLGYRIWGCPQTQRWLGQTSLLSAGTGKRLFHLALKSEDHYYWLTIQRHLRKMVSNRGAFSPWLRKKTRHSPVLSEAASSCAPSVWRLAMSAEHTVKIHTKTWRRSLRRECFKCQACEHLTVLAGHWKATLKQKSDVTWRCCHRSNKILFLKRPISSAFLDKACRPCMS